MKEKRKVHKSLLAILLVAFILPCCFLFTGCNEVYVSSIEYSYKKGDNSVYTVTYSNGKTSTIDVPGAEITTKDVFLACVERGLYENTDEDFKRFVSVYLTTNDVDSTKLNIYQAMNSAVSIRCSYNLTSSEIFAGSGVIFRMDDDFTYIITNCHVITDINSPYSHKLPEAIYVYTYGNEFEIDNNFETVDEFCEGLEASVVGYSVDHDLAVLKVVTEELKSKNSDASVAKIATGYHLMDEVYVIGNPKDYGISVTKGMVNVYSEYISTTMPTDNKDYDFRVMRIDAATYGGNSGGGVFNAKGELIGILNAGLIEDLKDSFGNTIYGDYENFGSALPIDMVIPCVENLIYYGSTSPVYKVKTVTMKQMGAILVNNYKDFNETNGDLTYEVRVSKITIGSTFYNNKLIKSNDIIKKMVVDDKNYDITWAHQIDDALLNARKGSTVKLTVNRGGVEQVVDISTIINNLL